MDTGGNWIYSNDNVTFSGKALKTPTLKRKGNKVSWSKVKGAKYQIKSGKKVKTIKKNSVSSKSKIQVKTVKNKNGITFVSAWSKKV